MISKVYNYVNRVPYAPIWQAELFKISSVKILVTSVVQSWKPLIKGLEKIDAAVEEYPEDEVC